MMIALCLFLTACEDADAELAIDLAIEWAFENGMVTCIDDAADPATCEIKLTNGFYRYVGGDVIGDAVSKIPVIGGLGELAGEMIQGENNPMTQEARDLVDTGMTAKDIVQADALADQGLAQSDPAKIQEAIEMRPNDWSYDEKLSVIYLANGEQQDASDAQNQAQAKAEEHLAGTLASEGLEKSDQEAYEACKRTYISLYSHRESALVQQLNKMEDSEDPTVLIQQLDLARKYLADLNGDLPGNQCSSYGPSK
jgi:succinate dehydrogenase/fumarate reductase flavoprotein subunit